MNVRLVKTASRYFSANIRLTRQLCYVCNKNTNRSPDATISRSKSTINEHSIRYYGDDSNDDSASLKYKLSGLRGIAGKYKIFQDFESPIILDVDEERELLRTNPDQLSEVVSNIDPYAGMDKTHGKTGVFDIEALVEVLRLENALDLVVISVPPKFQYVDYMVIVCGKSRKHVWSLGQFVRGLYKRKKYESDSYPVLEGDKDSSWLAMDMGNIVLHIFTRDARQHYDIELLWSVGHEYDDLANKKEADYIQLLEKYTHPAISELRPASANSETPPTLSSTKESCDLNS